MTIYLISAIMFDRNFIWDIEQGHHVKSMRFACQGQNSKTHDHNCNIVSWQKFAMLFNLNILNPKKLRLELLTGRQYHSQ